MLVSFFFASSLFYLVIQDDAGTGKEELDERDIVKKDHRACTPYHFQFFDMLTDYFDAPCATLL